MASTRGSRELILEAAREEFIQQGFSGARVARIAAAAQVNKQLIFYYFGSKSGLYEQVARQVMADVSSGGEPGESEAAPGRVRAAVAHLHDLLAEKPEVLAVLADSGRRPDARDASRGVVGDLVAPIRDAISTGQGEGYFRDDADPDLAAVQAVCLCFGYAALRDLLPTDGSTDDRWNAQVGDLLARGLAW